MGVLIEPKIIVYRVTKGEEEGEEKKKKKTHAFHTRPWRVNRSGTEDS